MRNILLTTLLLLTLDILFQGCANPGRPTGGPKDTIPPTLLYSVPSSGTTNFTSNELVLEFSEYVNADKLQQQLIITPKTDIPYKATIKRNKLYLKLDGDLDDSTTYNFNFADGLTDITEQNPAVNLSLAFSTGSYIDSLSVSGKIQNLLTQENAEGFVVGLYLNTDTLDYFTQKPLYFTTTGDSGRYVINYIKNGTYKILTFDDQNGNYILDPETESHGFIADSITLISPLNLPIIPTILQNVKPITLINARPTGPYVEIKFNKQPSKYSISPDNLNHQIIGDNKDAIRIYKPHNVNYGDSIKSKLIVSDSLGNTLTENIKYAFLESNRSPTKFTFTVTPPQLNLLADTTLAFQFSKPVINYKDLSLTATADSTFSYPLKGSAHWNHNQTTLNYRLSLNRDSLNKAFYLSLPKDTATQDTTEHIGAVNPQASLRPSDNRKLKIEIPDASFISVEYDTSGFKELSIIEPKQSPTGLLRLSVNTDYSSYTIQLINEKGNVAYQTDDTSTEIFFRDIKPSNYKIRVLIDDNKDGSYSYGNLLQQIQPESVFLHPDLISVRENWEVEVPITF